MESPSMTPGILNPISPDVDPDWTLFERPPLPADDLEYLQKKGALIVPETALMVDLLTAYCNWIHPQLPIIDLHSFLRSLSGNGSKTSILLLQTVLFTGAAHITEEAINSYGFASRDCLQETLYQRAKLLCHFEAERDVLVLAQAHLLMSVSHQCSKTSTIWHAQAHLFVQKLGLEDKRTYLVVKSALSRLYKRLWWSLFVRDYTLKMEIGAAQHFQETSYQVPDLTLDCFDTSAFPLFAQQMLPRAKILKETHLYLRLAWLAIQKAELVCHLREIYMVRSQSDRARYHRIFRFLEQNLSAWVSGFDVGLPYDPGECQVFDYHRGLLMISYFSTSNILLQGFLQPPHTEEGDSRIRLKVETNTRRLLEQADELYRSERRLPPTLGMGMIYNAISLYLELEEWRRTRTAELASLEPAFRCLAGLKRSAPKETSLQMALGHLQNRITILERSKVTGIKYDLPLLETSPSEIDFLTPVKFEAWLDYELDGSKRPDLVTCMSPAGQLERAAQGP
ncbi:Fungal specific transcription factor domain-containing protein [Cladophialophora immunda]|nr:Fungal specific transcription factor domain-containing protein [Cladophialophora immunda]